ncbi:MAG: GNAT family N-acetyltransferase [Calditrichaeota bacterium]|nr:GNAT family N-acetyltransferase [Calditrichota bacterium]
MPFPKPGLCKRARNFFLFSRGGSAWYRLWTHAEHSYGCVDSETPELGVGVCASHRSKGVGRALGLSVAPEKFARQLYESEGFVKIGESGSSWTFLLNPVRGRELKSKIEDRQL